MKILNVVFLLFIKFINIQIFTLIANFVESVSVYDQIPPFNVPIPNSYVVFDLLDDDLDHYYPLGLTVQTLNESEKEFSVDNLATFGKEIKIVFGNRCVSLTTFARNIKAKLTSALLWYTVTLEYDLLGSKITKKFEEHGITLTNEIRRFKTYPEIVIPDSADEKPEILEDEGLGDEEMEDSAFGEVAPIKSQPHKPKETSDISQEELEIYSATVTEVEGEKDQEDSTKIEVLGEDEDDSKLTLPAVPPTQVTTDGKIDITQSNLSSALGFKDSDVIVAGTADFKCVYFENTGDVYTRLHFKSSKLKLPETAEYFDICYSEQKGDYYIVVSSLFSSVVVEQTYKHGTFGLSALGNFNHFEGLKTLFDRRIKQPSHELNPSDSPLDLHTYEPDDNSFLEKIVCQKCTVFRYIDGLETVDRVGTVTCVKFGDFEYKLKPEKRFVMASVCNPYLSTRYVSIMVKEAFAYENRIFYSSDGKTYQERKHLEDEERLSIINMTSKVWHKRNKSGKIGNVGSGPDENVEVLCLNQLTGTKTSTSKSCKDIDKLENFRVQFNSKEMTHLYYRKNKPKSSVLIGNLMFDLNTVTDGHKYIYLSHPENEPISLLVVEKYNESYAIIETAKGSNLFMPVNDALEDSPSRFSRKDVNAAIYRGSMYGITWDYNDHLKTHYLFPSNFPDYCLGDLTFHNMKVLSYRGEGYKQISTNDKNKLVKIKVTAVMSKKKVVLDVEVSGNNTKVEWVNKPSPDTDKDTSPIGNESTSTEDRSHSSKESHQTSVDHNETVETQEQEKEQKKKDPKKTKGKKNKDEEKPENEVESDEDNKETPDSGSKPSKTQSTKGSSSAKPTGKPSHGTGTPIVYTKHNVHSLTAMHGGTSGTSTSTRDAGDESASTSYHDDESEEEEDRVESLDVVSTPTKSSPTKSSKPSTPIIPMKSPSLYPASTTHTSESKQTGKSEPDTDSAYQGGSDEEETDLDDTQREAPSSSPSSKPILPMKSPSVYFTSTSGSTSVNDKEETDLDDTPSVVPSSSPSSKDTTPIVTMKPPSRHIVSTTISNNKREESDDEGLENEDEQEKQTSDVSDTEDQDMP